MHKHRVHCCHTNKQEFKAIEINQEKTFSATPPPHNKSKTKQTNQIQESKRIKTKAQHATFPAIGPLLAKKHH